jgi:hypothetical protein
MRSGHKRTALIAYCRSSELLAGCFGGRESGSESSDSERDQIERDRPRRPAPRHNDRLAAQLRIVPLLHGRVERVHVHMNDLASGHLASILFRGPGEPERCLFVRSLLPSVSALAPPLFAATSRLVSSVHDAAQMRAGEALVRYSCFTNCAIIRLSAVDSLLCLSLIIRT